MLKVILCSCRHPAMTRDQFFRYLTHTHAPLVLEVPEFLRHLRGYVQNHILLEEDIGDVPTRFRRAADRDSVIALWFENKKSLAEAMNEPRYLELVRPDEARFNDLSRLIVVVTEERVVFDGLTGGLKAFEFIKRKKGVSREQFVNQWQHQGAVLAADVQYRRFVTKRIQNVAVANDDNAFAPSAAYDGVLEFWADSAEAFGKLQDSRFRIDEESFVDHQGSFSVLATEVPIYNQFVKRSDEGARADEQVGA